MSSQLTLPIFLSENFTFENFYPGKNSSLLACLKEMTQGKGESYLYLWGQSGVGCSHLLQASCHSVYANQQQAFYLSLMQGVQELSLQLLENLETYALVCLDDIEAIKGNTAWEEALFHFYNRFQQTPTRLIITGHSVPKELALELPDLVSRLEHGVIWQVHDLNDEEKIAVLVQRAHERGLELPVETAHFMLRHLARDLGSLLIVLDNLDQASLAEQRRLTIPFVKSQIIITPEVTSLK